MTPRLALAGVLVVALALVGALFAWRALQRRSAPVTGTGPVATAPGPGARTGTLAALLDPRARWAGGGGASMFVGGERATVLVTCGLGDPRSLRALDAASDWLAAYRPRGIEVVGVAVPRHAWERDSLAVTRELERRGIAVPVLLDSDLRVSRALGLDAEPPGFALMDPAGVVTLRAGDAAELAAALERLVLGLPPRAPGAGAGVAPRSAATAPGGAPRALELGAAFAPRGPLADVAPGRPRRFHAQFRSDLEGERWIAYPAGLWTLGADGLAAARGGAEQFVALRYHAVPLGAVMSPPAAGSARVWLLRDGRWLGAAEAADDVRFDGRGASYVEVDAPRLYALCRDDGGEHRVTLSPEAAGVTIHGFRFEPVPPARPSP